MHRTALQRVPNHTVEHDGGHGGHSAATAPHRFLRLPDTATYRARLDPAVLTARREVEGALAHLYEGDLPGYCVACGTLRRFRFSPAPQGGLPNWREELDCDHCRLFNRVRFCLAFLLQELRSEAPQVYITEQVTYAYAWLKSRWPTTIGSEYLGETTPVERLTGYMRYLTGDPAAELRHEDLTALTLPDASQDAVLSFDVLEHIPDADAALRELFRVLRPGGLLVFTVPFMTDAEQSLLRARIGPQGIEHLVEPEYHGDPAMDGGCLAFHSFGWDLLERLRAVGFDDVGLLDGWSPASGNLGLMGALTARRPR